VGTEAPDCGDKAMKGWWLTIGAVLALAAGKGKTEA
jgi:hypothetical protein